MHFYVSDIEGKIRIGIGHSTMESKLDKLVGIGPKTWIFLTEACFVLKKVKKKSLVYKIHLIPK